jgi:hypothetical protein
MEESCRIFRFLPTCCAYGTEAAFSSEHDRAKPCKGDTLLTVGEAEGVTYGSDNGYILSILHP